MNNRKRRQQETKCNKQQEPKQKNNTNKPTKTTNILQQDENYATKAETTTQLPKNSKVIKVTNTSLAAKGALAHHLQRRTTCITLSPA